jgi:hypothetical protein
MPLSGEPLAVAFEAAGNEAMMSLTLGEPEGRSCEARARLLGVDE